MEDTMSLQFLDILLVSALIFSSYAASSDVNK